MIKDSKKLRYICTVLYALLFVLQLFFCLVIFENPSPISWICVGWCAGLFVASLFSNSSNNMQDKIIHMQSELIDESCKVNNELHKILNGIIKKEQSKKSTKGGKKKKK